MNDPVWIEKQEILVLHDYLLALEGGPTGLCSEALLESGLARPRELHAYGTDPDMSSWLHHALRNMFAITHLWMATSEPALLLAYSFSK